MGQLREKHIEYLVALLFALYVFDVPRLIIEIWAIPFPRFGGRPPYLFPFAVIAGAALVVLARRRQAPTFEPIDSLFVLSMGVMAAIGIAHAVGPADLSIGLPVDLAVAYSGFLLARLHYRAFGSLDRFMATIMWVAVAIIAVHLLLLAIHRVGLPPLGADPGEVVQRNGISFLFIPLLFWLWFIRGGSFGPWQLSLGLPLVAVGQMWLNGARGALLVVLAMAFVKYVMAADRSVGRARLALGLSVLGVIGLTLLQPAVTSFGAGLIPEGDSGVSTLSRLTTNYDLVMLTLDSPLTGIGEAMVGEVQFAGYMSHTLPIIILSSYGVVGLMPLAVVIWLIVRLYGASGQTTVLAVATILLVTLFINDAWPWMGVLIAAAAVWAPGGGGVLNRLGSEATA